MVQGLGLAESTPGPLIMVTQYVGFIGAWNDPGPFAPLLYGTLGALITTYATFLPCFLFIFLLAPYIELLANDRRLRAVLVGVTAAVVGVIANLAVFFATQVLFPDGVSLQGLDVFALIVAVVSFVVLQRFKVPIYLHGPCRRPRGDGMDAPVEGRAQDKVAHLDLPSPPRAFAPQSRRVAQTEGSGGPLSTGRGGRVARGCCYPRAAGVAAAPRTGGRGRGDALGGPAQYRSREQSPSSKSSAPCARRRTGSLSTARAQLRRKAAIGAGGTVLLEELARIERDFRAERRRDYFRSPLRKVAAAAIREARRVVKEGAGAGRAGGAQGECSGQPGADVTWTGRPAYG